MNDSHAEINRDPIPSSLKDKRAREVREGGGGERHADAFALLALLRDRGGISKFNILISLKIGEIGVCGTEPE